METVSGLIVMGISLFDSWSIREGAFVLFGSLAGLVVRIAIYSKKNMLWLGKVIY